MSELDPVKSDSERKTRDTYIGLLHVLTTFKSILPVLVSSQVVVVVAVLLVSAIEDGVGVVIGLCDGVTTGSNADVGDGRTTIDPM